MSFQHRTEALNQVAERLAWDQETMMPRGAAGQRAEEIAAIAIYLASDESTFTTGTTFSVDGGISI